MRIQCLRHVHFEGPAGIAAWAAARGHPLTETCLFDGEALPNHDAYDALVVMGGPMGIGDEADFPWLRPEKRFIAAAIGAGKRIIGVCLGAQLLADALGAAVAPLGHKEIGWFPIELTDEARADPLFADVPSPSTVFHWHGDRFELPPGAMRIARSDGCDNQGFVVERRILALQFHLEATHQSVSDLVEHCGSEIVPAAYVQTREQMLLSGVPDYAMLERSLWDLLDRFFANS